MADLKQVLLQPELSEQPILVHIQGHEQEQDFLLTAHEDDTDSLNPDAVRLPSSRPISRRASVTGHAVTNGHDTPLHQEEKSTFAWTTLQLAKVILGSGILVLPRAFQILGCALAIALLSLIGLLTWYTIKGLVYASEKTGKYTYAAVVRARCGKPAKWGLLAAVFTNCAGMCIVFLVIYADVLVGSAPDYNGIIHDLMPQLSPAHWIFNRSLAAGIVVLTMLVPLSVQRDLQRLSGLALVGVGAVVAFAIATIWLTIAAYQQGRLQHLPWLPNWDALTGTETADKNSRNGQDSTHSWVAFIMGVTGVAPLLLNADICHQSIFPAMSLLKPYSRRSFNAVAACALTLCNVLYTLIAVCCILVFGKDLDSNILTNMSAADMTPLLGPQAAACVALLVRVSYFISLLGSFVFVLHPLRHCTLEILLGSNFLTMKQAKADQLFLPVTLALLAGCYLVAIGMPGIWVVLQLVGSCSSTFMGFIFPALVIYSLMNKRTWVHRLERLVAVVVISIGLFLFVNGFAVVFGTTTSN